MKRKFYKDSLLDIDENFNFVEEVPIEEVKEYEFDDPTEDRKKNFIIILILILSLSLFGGGLYYAFVRPDPKNVITNRGGDLFVVHSSVDFGSTVNSFISYISKEAAFSYTFYVQNEAKNEITYKVKIKHENIKGLDIIDYKNLNYSLIKNKEEIATGTLKEILATTTIKGNSTDYFEIKLWSNYPTAKAYAFTIEIIE